MRLPSLLFFILVSAASHTFASTLSVNISTTAFSPVTFHNDNFSLDAYSGTVVLDSAAPVIATVNQANFFVAIWPDWPGYDYGSTDPNTISVDSAFTLGRQLTIDAVSQSITQPAAFHLTYIADDVTGYVSGPTAFDLGSNGIVDVTLNYFLKNAFITDQGMNSFDVSATFAWTPLSNKDTSTPSVPEPASLAILGIGLAGLALSKRKPQI